MGKTLYHLLRGQLPDTTRNHDLPQSVRDLVMDLVARDPADRRPPTAREVGEKLARLVGHDEVRTRR